MNHGLKLLEDGTLIVTLPKDKEVTRVLISWSGTQSGTLFHPDLTSCTGCVNDNSIACRSCSRRFIDKYKKGED